MTTPHGVWKIDRSDYEKISDAVKNIPMSFPIKKWFGTVYVTHVYVQTTCNDGLSKDRRESDGRASASISGRCISSSGFP